jgi:formylglycine-generating enzyme required for sulfatase activity
MTIAANVLGVASNWSTGTVGSGFIYSGHNDNVPANALAADPSDANGYAGTGNVANSNQKRTLTLSNGEVIWDLVGNVWEWTSGTVQSPVVQPGITGNGANWREWPAITNPGTLSINPSPAGTGIAGASTWNTGNGIGAIYSNADEVGLRGFIRGGTWGDGSYAGVLGLNLYNAPGHTDTSLGFRVASP